MKRLILVLAVGAAALAGCDDPRPEETETAPPPMEAPAPPPPETPPPVQTTPPPPTDVTALPPDQRASEETVKPESETLFY
ncbi:hypothetical protein BH09PSE1_BH09PSE1_05930 [soil metagenome]